MTTTPNSSGCLWSLRKRTRRLKQSRRNNRGEHWEHGGNIAEIHQRQNKTPKAIESFSLPVVPVCPVLLSPPLFPELLVQLCSGNQSHSRARSAQTRELQRSDRCFHRTHR